MHGLNDYKHGTNPHVYEINAWKAYKYGS